MEKTVIAILKALSATAYILIFLLIFSLPVIFIYEALQPPVFTFDSVAVEADFQGDEIIAEDEAGLWQRIEFSLIAHGGKFSPYSFKIDKFALASGQSENVKIVLDEPIFCNKDTADPFTLTVYVKSTEDIQEFIKSASFKASDYEKSFGEFSLKFIDGKASLMD